MLWILAEVLVVKHQSVTRPGVLIGSGLSGFRCGRVEGERNFRQAAFAQKTRYEDSPRGYQRDTLVVEDESVQQDLIRDSLAVPQSELFDMRYRPQAKLSR
jgi:hypothetical protein